MGTWVDNDDSYEEETDVHEDVSVNEMVRSMAALVAADEEETDVHEGSDVNEVVQPMAALNIEDRIRQYESSLNTALDGIEESKESAKGHYKGVDKGGGVCPGCGKSFARLELHQVSCKGDTFPGRLKQCYICLHLYGEVNRNTSLSRH